MKSPTASARPGHPTSCPMSNTRGSSIGIFPQTPAFFRDTRVQAVARTYDLTRDNSDARRKSPAGRPSRLADQPSRRCPRCGSSGMLDEEFAFVPECNEGGEFMAYLHDCSDRFRLGRIAGWACSHLAGKRRLFTAHPDSERRSSLRFGSLRTIGDGCVVSCVSDC